MTPKDKARFEKKFRVTPGCWVWTSYRDKDGYGGFSIEHVTFRAHRVAYMMYVGEIDDGMLICHKCDNPSCVNPDHLYQGTQQKNMRDMRSKNRGAINNGVLCGGSKLSESQVLEIRSLKQSQSAIARKYGVAQSTISLIVNRKTWTHI